tara:strand:- start:798 stop:920 length:123 start_codon:yes stop_codon:yes gene_type:complete
MVTNERLKIIKIMTLINDPVRLLQQANGKKGFDTVFHLKK